MDMRPSSMTEMLTRMEAQSLITREQDKKDTRIIHIHLTDEGRSMDKEAAGNAEELVVVMFKGFFDEETRELLALIRKLGVNLYAMAPAFGPHDRHGCTTVARTAAIPAADLSTIIGTSISAEQPFVCFGAPLPHCSAGYNEVLLFQLSLGASLGCRLPRLFRYSSRPNI